MKLLSCIVAPFIFVLASCSDQPTKVDHESERFPDVEKHVDEKVTVPALDSTESSVSAASSTVGLAVTTSQYLPTESIMEPTAHTENESQQRENQNNHSIVQALCAAIGAKLGSVSVDECLRQKLEHSALSTNLKSLSYKEYPPIPPRKPLGRVLLIGGIHGDEYSSVSIVFKWMNILTKHHSGLFQWRIVPAANPDGLLRTKSRRQNNNGVDLNRNFPTDDWNIDAHDHWEKVAFRNPRRDPGPSMASEVETRWLVEQIRDFDPDVIVSVHAPHHLVDYDGPPTAPQKLGGLQLHQLGVYPGSLGNYAGIGLDLPVVTVELKSAGIMPSNTEIDRMWSDLVEWLHYQLTERSRVAASIAP